MMVNRLFFLKKKLFLTLSAILIANIIQYVSTLSLSIPKNDTSAFHEPEYISTTPMYVTFPSAIIYGIRVEGSPKPVYYEEGISVILADSPTKIRVFGYGFTYNTHIRFVTEGRPYGYDCDDVPSTKNFKLEFSYSDNNSAVATIQLPPLDVDASEFYVCTREGNLDMPWVHQGQNRCTVLRSFQNWLPLWGHIWLLVLLLMISGLFSGLNLGLMAIDRTELKIIEKTGTEAERRYAKKIKPLRNKGNFLLCSILLGNVLLNSTVTILLDDITTGLIAVIGSTLGIVVFAEVIPQAFCSRHGLAVGANTIWLTKLTMLLTSPISYPVSFVLDKILGKEIGNVYNRERLKELIKVTQHYNDLKNDEMKVIEGVLKLSQVHCGDAMTSLEDCFMLPINSILNFDTIDSIVKSGYSRIPIYDGIRTNIVSILYTKDLAFVDPDDEMPLKSLCDFRQYQCNFVDEKKPLDLQLKEFKGGKLGHLAFVQRTHEKEGSGQVIGILTLEDVIEEMIQAEISDETDVQVVTGDQQKSHEKNSNNNGMSSFLGIKTDATVVSAQVTLAAYQYLSTTVQGFSSKFLSTTALQRLLGKDVWFKVRLRNFELKESDDSVFLYRKGIAADYFVLILEGRVQSSVGKENLMFDGGPFTYFGVQCLNISSGDPDTPTNLRRTLSSPVENGNAPQVTTYVPDYTVRAITDVTYLKIHRALYIAALKSFNSTVE